MTKILLPTLWLLCTLPVLADSVWLKNGNRLEGQARTLANGDVEIHSVGGTLRLPARIVDRIEAGKTTEELAREELAGLTLDDIQGRYDLALRVDSSGSSTMARRLLDEVVRLDPSHAEARRRLGQVDCDGQWLSAIECHEDRGEVYWRGNWIHASEWARIEALEVQRRAAASERRRQEARWQALLLASERVRTPSYSAYGQPYYWGTGVVVAPPVVAPSSPLPDVMRRPIVATPAPPTTPPSNHGRFLAPAVPSTARAAAISRR